MITNGTMRTNETRMDFFVNLLSDWAIYLKYHLKLYVYCFQDRWLTFCPFSSGYCVVCSSIYGIGYNPADIFILFFQFQREISRTLGKEVLFECQSRVPKLSHMFRCFIFDWSIYMTCGYLDIQIHHIQAFSLNKSDIVNIVLW